MTRRGSDAIMPLPTDTWAVVLRRRGPRKMRHTGLLPSPDEGPRVGRVLATAGDVLWRVWLFLRLLRRSPWFNYIGFFRTVRRATHGRGGRLRRCLGLQLYGERALAETLRACGRAGVAPFLLFGTLLGHCREGGFIAHDHDIDLGLCERDFARLAELKREMQRSGYRVEVESDLGVQFKKRRFRNLAVDFYRVHEEKGEMVCSVTFDRAMGLCHYPPDIFATLEPARFRGRLAVIVPARAEEYLTLTYGAWRTPQPDFDLTRDYLNVSRDEVKPCR